MLSTDSRFQRVRFRSAHRPRVNLGLAHFGGHVLVLLKKPCAGCPHDFDLVLRRRYRLFQAGYVRIKHVRIDAEQILILLLVQNL